VDYNWGLSFIIPGVMIAVMGFILFLFLVPYPEEVGLLSDDDEEAEATRREAAHITNSTSVESGSRGASPERSPVRRKLRRVEGQGDIEAIEDEGSPLIDSRNGNSSSEDMGAVSFMEALFIPGVIEFSLSLFFCKLVSYTFLYWLPMYIKASTTLDSKETAYLSTPFDLGGIAGAVVAGIVADRTGASGLTCIGMLIFTIPSMLIYYWFGTASYVMNVVLQIITGALVNGPYSLITTAVSADLGNRVTSSKALATVTAIIDGTGSIGAAVGPLIAGLLSKDWSYVFYMVMAADLVSLLLLLRIGKQEIHKIRNRS
jgi:OPA family glycerol-3-phosphate transporter-like MFS transporter 1/2